MLVQAHKDFIHDLRTAMGKEPVHTSGTDTRDKGLAMEDQRNPSEEFSFMHNCGVGNEATDPATHDAMPHFFGTLHRILFPVFFYFDHPNSYILQGSEQWSRHSTDPTSGHEDNIHHGEAYNDGNKNCDMTTNV
jgi:hypothetical protein